MNFEVPKDHFVKPDIMSEKGEFERVAEELGIDSSVLFFQAQDGRLVSLSEGVWQNLENTDSNRFNTGDWDFVDNYSSQQDIARDWRDLRNKLETGHQLDAPIVLKFGDRYHLVSGNTRLMVSKAAGITPEVFLFEIDV